jgi:hypothetical protein
MRNLNHSFHECEGELKGDEMLMLIADLDENHIMNDAHFCSATYTDSELSVISYQPY